MRQGTVKAVIGLGGSLKFNVVLWVELELETDRWDGTGWEGWSCP